MVFVPLRLGTLRLLHNGAKLFAAVITSRKYPQCLRGDENFLLAVNLGTGDRLPSTRRKEEVSFARLAEAFRNYQRTLKLPCDSLDQGRPHKAKLDAGIKEARMSLATHNSQPKCVLQDTEAGNLAGNLKTSSYEVTLRTTFGHNLAFSSGARSTFVSYGILAESRVTVSQSAIPG